MDRALAEKVDILFVDTAGRLQTKVNLMEELTKIRQVLGKKHEGAPHRCILVIDDCVREEDWDLFLQTLGHLGYLDAKMQIQLLESGKTELAMREEKLRHQLPEQKRVWQSLGILGGAFLVVILI